MAIVEQNSQRIVLRSGSTTLTLDRTAGGAVLRRKILFWQRKPRETPLSDIATIAADAHVDPASGADLWSTRLVMRDGAAWTLAAADRNDALASAVTLRDFLGLKE
ncbi:MAG: hypothetical protein HY056_05735 [Proteobacteria bacterium]|nr:hypothetical protein [Pseudomonadota bacterium]